MSKNKYIRQKSCVEARVKESRWVLFEDGDRNGVGDGAHFSWNFEGRDHAFNSVSSVRSGRMLYTSYIVTGSLNEWTNPCLRIIDFLKNPTLFRPVQILKVRCLNEDIFTESLGKKTMHMASLRKGGVPANPPPRNEWCFLGNWARGRPWKKLLHTSLWERTSPKEKGHFLDLSAPALENHLESRGFCEQCCWEEEWKLHFSRILAPQTWAGTVHPRPGLPILSLLTHSPFSLGGVCVLSSSRALTP